LPDKGSAAGLDDPQHFVEAARVVDFPHFAEEAEHSHLELVDH
jgi:hypothetical protein